MRLLFGLLLFSLWASFARYYYVCEIKHMCEPQEEIIESPERLQNLTLQYGDEKILEDYNQFYFKQGIAQPTLDSSNTAFLEGIASYMIDNEDKKLKITGQYLESEANIPVGSFDNLGIARASAIEQELLAMGIPDDRISLDYFLATGDKLTEPISFEILAATDDDLADVQFTFTNMTFTESNFKFDSDEFTPKESFIFYADSLKTYFELNPDKSLTIIGHTDKIGKQSYNKTLGLDRAKSAKAYLLKNIGIETEINVESMGEKKPMANNKTEAGRSRNRRVNFVIE